jgi:tetratricopeptide (TPR) repeat protein
MLGRPKEAHTAYLEAVRLARLWVDEQPGADAHEALGLYCAKSGQADCALTEATRSLALLPDNADAAFSTAIINCVLGKETEALDWLEKAVNLGMSKAEIKNEPNLAPLHDLPRYKAILALAS